ncbi:hypothetical protein [Streptomyces sp. NPDC056056]|uniref:hypothetical protein n=1 Tax=Streptomyces sp. NPDC056056 TaxID=3345698 RepID=UPI0035D5A7D6
MTVLPSIAAVDLPPLVYAHRTEHDPALTAPEHFRPIRSEGWVKPLSGTGLWTAPVTAWAADGLPADTDWLRYCREAWDPEEASYYTHFTAIAPNLDARVLRIDSHVDLIAIVDAHPASLNIPSLRERRYPDWVALAQTWDAVFLTDEGQWATRRPRYGPDLYGWDVASVLWLRPAYSVGRTSLVPVAEVTP